MTTIRTRDLRSLAGVGAASALLLSGCGLGLPTQAATVGNQSLSDAQVNAAAAGVCSAWTKLGQSLMSLGRVRGDAAFGLAEREMADQMAAEYDVEISPAYGEAVKQAVSGLPENVTQAEEDRLVEVYFGRFYLEDISKSAAVIELQKTGIDQPEPAQIANRAEALRAEWEAAHPVKFDPRLGVVYSDLTPSRGGDTSYAVSAIAKAGAKGEESPEMLKALPADQRCGASTA